MGVSRGLRRLLRIRDLEEEQKRVALESAMGELRRLENALETAMTRNRRGRGLVDASARSGELIDRQAGLVESQTAMRYAVILSERIVEAEREAARMRGEFLAKRIERRQAETLIEEAKKGEAIDQVRRSQQSLDDWHRVRLYRQQLEAELNRPSQTRCDADLLSSTKFEET